MDLIILASAATFVPGRRTSTSPGTISDASTSDTRPSLNTFAFGAAISPSAVIASFALNSLFTSAITSTRITAKIVIASSTLPQTL